jgi:hypothetical protein
LLKNNTPSHIRHAHNIVRLEIFMPIVPVGKCKFSGLVQVSELASFVFAIVHNVIFRPVQASVMLKVSTFHPALFADPPTLPMVPFAPSFRQWYFHKFFKPLFTIHNKNQANQSFHSDWPNSGQPVNSIVMRQSK